MTRVEKQNTLKGLLFISPWLLGFLAFAAYPVIASFYFSFTDYSVLAKPVPIGIANYQEMATDSLFWKAVTNTFGFAIVSVPINLAVAFFLALLLTFRVPARGIYRTLFFLPSLVPMVCLGVIWRWLLNGELGLINLALDPFIDILNTITGSRLHAPSWLEDPSFTKPGLLVASIWGIGHSMIIFLAGMQETPNELYEAAEIDGAGFWSKLRHITIPSISPYIYFNLIMGLIGSLQIFAVPYVLMDGANNPEDGPGRSLLFVATYIFQNAFEYWNMGYACAIAFIFIILVTIMTLSVMKVAEKKVYYAGE